MISVVVTGNAGSGKTYFCKLMAKEFNKTAYFNSDKVIKKIYYHKDVKNSLIEICGKDVYLSNGLINLPLLRIKAFQNKNFKKKLENILHPKLLSECLKYQQYYQKKKYSIFIAEIPLYFEINVDISFHFSVVVACSYDLQIERLCRRKGYNVKIAKNILNSQMQVEKKIANADHIIWNKNKSTDIIIQGHLIWNLYT